MNWKEKFDNYSGTFPTTEQIIDFISTEIIEKLIDGIPENKVYGHQSEAINEIKWQLRKEWL